jgi:hypothetical protein
MHLGRVTDVEIAARRLYLADELQRHGRDGLAVKKCATLWGMCTRSVEITYLAQAREINRQRAPNLDAARRQEWVTQLSRVAYRKNTPPATRVAALSAAARVEGFGLAPTNNVNVASASANAGEALAWRAAMDISHDHIPGGSAAGTADSGGGGTPGGDGNSAARVGAVGSDPAAPGVHQPADRGGDKSGGDADAATVPGPAR